MRTALKLLIGLVFSFIILNSSFIIPVYAQESPSPSPSASCDPRTSDSKSCPIDSSNYKAPQNADYTLTNLEHGLLCQLAGQSPEGSCIGLGQDKKGKVTAMLFDKIPGGGATGGLALAVGGLYSNPPTSTAEYLADMGSNLGLVSPAYAQSVTGSGDGVVRPVLKLWQAVRNLTYIAFILVFIVVGLMVMFRQKVNQQTVVSIQEALPGMVVGLILITFSYFIAALLVDLSFIGMQVAVHLFDPSSVGPNYFGDLNRLQEYANTSSVFDLFRGAALRPQNISDVAGGLANIAFQGPGSFGLSALITGVVGGVIGFMVGGPIGIAAGAVAGPLLAIPILSLIIPLILVVALIVQLFRLLFELINSYIQILLMTIAGPVFILVASLPGRRGALSNWWRCILANSLVFPAVFVAFLFAGLILGSQESWQSTLPLFGGIGTNILKLFVAYGVILGTPAIPKMVRNALGCKGPQEYAQAAMQGYMSGINITRGAATAGYNRMMAPLQAQRKAYQERVARARAEGKEIENPPTNMMAGTKGPLGWGPLQGAFDRYIKRGT